MHWWYMPSLFLNTCLKCLQHGWLLFLILFHQWNPSVCAVLLLLSYYQEILWFGLVYGLFWSCTISMNSWRHDSQHQLFGPSKLVEMVDGVGWQQWHRLVRRQWCKDESSNTLPHSQHTGGELRRICDYSRQCSLFCRLHQNKGKC